MLCKSDALTFYYMFQSVELIGVTGFGHFSLGEERHGLVNYLIYNG